MNKPFPPGHLKNAMPTLIHSQGARAIMSKKSRQHWTLQKMKPAALNWKWKETQ